MTPERWQQISGIFHGARERDRELRHAFLAEACGEDSALRDEVEAMLAGDDAAGRFGDAPLFIPAASGSSPDPDPGMRLAPGMRLGPYEIIAAIGAGGMGEVYRAHDTRLGRDVAIKILPRTFADDTSRVIRFRQEARVLASLNHPNIAAIYGLERSDDVDYLILELVEGEMLRGPVSVTTTLDYACQIVAALEAAHGKGIIHRDLKPANVKVTSDGTVKLLDFGLAKAVWGSDTGRELSGGSISTGSVETMAGHIVGSPSYMSPEQARGDHVDERTDLWAFGCLLYELLTGKQAFPGDGLTNTIAGVLELEPDWALLPDDTPKALVLLVRSCLEKTPAARVQTIAHCRRSIERSRRRANRWQVAALAAAALATLALATLGLGGAMWSRGPDRSTGRSEWLPITRLSDSVSQPALSPDGKQLAFIRGPATFFGPGQVYVKSLPDGEPVQLTHDDFAKMGPAFSPDGMRIAYTTVGDRFDWDTWVVPALGGEPRRWLVNASGLVWGNPGHVLFSEIKHTPHMAIVAADENRDQPHDVYVPAHEHAMAHRSYLSPDGKWVLIAQMDMDHVWMPCRLVPIDGSSQGRQVGPSAAGCTTGSWSPDGQWMYVTANPGGVHHIWRQRFPDGVPEQVTFGPTEERGIAMAPDGRSFITAVALQNLSIWLHDDTGERQISALEGIAANPRFTADGARLCYTIVKEAPTLYSPQPGEVWVADLKSGRSESLVPGFVALDYDVAPDGQQVVIESPDAEGRHRLWLVPFDHHSPPQQIPNVEGAQPRFGAGNEVFFRRDEDSLNFVYRVNSDGSGLRRVLPRTIPLLLGVSRDSRWVIGWAELPDHDGMAIQAFPRDGGTAVRLGDFIEWDWSAGGDALAVSDGPVVTNRSYIIPLPPGQALPMTPASGFRFERELADLPGARRIDARAVPGPSPGVYAYYRGTTQRNLYRVPVP